MRINGNIRAREIFLIGENGEQMGNMSPDEAIKLAQEAGLDVVEVNPNASPPVCRIMDYGKYLYETKKNQKKGHGGPLPMKELRIRPKTGEHDVKTKIDQGRRFLEKGHKVQLTMLLRGRERAHPDRAEAILATVATMLADMAKVEQEAKLAGNRMSMLFAPDKVAIARMVAAREKEEASKAATPGDGQPAPEPAEASSDGQVN